MIRFSFVLIFSLLSTVSVAQERWQDSQYIEDSFIKIALGREYRETKNAKLIRWERPITIFFESEAGDPTLQKELLSTQAKHLSHITGLSINFTNNSKHANLFAIFTTYQNMENKVRQYIGNPEKIRAALNEAICLGTFNTNSRSEIVKGTIIIPVDYAREKARLLDCIVEEITQLLGLPNDSNDVFPSVFNDNSIDTYLSPLDYILLKVLYSQQLRAGMTNSQTRSAFPRVLSTLHSTGSINGALQEVQKHSLKRYLGD